MAQDDWKSSHANEANSYIYAQLDAEDISLTPLLDGVVREFAENMGFEYAGLHRYGLHKIVRYTAQVVLARAKGFDPELLRLTADEATEAQLTLLRMFEESGVPTTVVVVGDEASS